jgi:2-polyprenyl-3-methyl-5-hydroxy-6-metoxy-1,4-benzoquinol methylase
VRIRSPHHEELGVSEEPGRADLLTESWTTNAAAWTRAVREGRIASRRLATDAAVVDAVVARAPRRVLDVGCGEGWLARALAARGIEVTGIDVSAPLVEAARALGGGTFHVVDYDDAARDPARLGGPYDVAVCNFALLAEAITPLLAALRARLAPGGAVVIQTVHPWTARGDSAYADGWRTETFAGFGEGFAAAMPWYYRTLASWVAVVREAGLRVAELREPVNPESGAPLSLVIVAE